MDIPTVRVKSSHPDHEQGFFIINKSDFDEAIHELWVDEAAKAKRAEAADAAKAAQPAVQAGPARRSDPEQAKAR